MAAKVAALSAATESSARAAHADESKSWTSCTPRIYATRPATHCACDRSATAPGPSGGKMAVVVMRPGSPMHVDHAGRLRLVLALCAILVAAESAQAEYYMFKDDSGALRFTNSPAKPGFKFFALTPLNRRGQALERGDITFDMPSPVIKRSIQISRLVFKLR